MAYRIMNMVVIFMFFKNTTSAQIPELVLPDLPEGEKLIYFDSLLRPTELENACYFMYTYFHMGKDVWSLKHPWRKEKYRLEWSGMKPGLPGSPVAMHGVAKWLTNDYSRLIAEEQFVNGRFGGRTVVYDRKGNAAAVYDYDKKLDGNVWSLYVEKYRKKQVDKAGFETYNLKEYHWDTICTIGCYISKDFRP